MKNDFFRCWRCSSRWGFTALRSPTNCRTTSAIAEDEKSARLEIAIKTFTMPSGQKVDLIGVVHIADEQLTTRS